LRYACLLRRFYDIHAAVFWQRRNDTARRCGFILRRLHRAILRVAVFPHCVALEFILNFKNASMPREI